MSGLDLTQLDLALFYARCDDAQRKSEIENSFQFDGEPSLSQTRIAIRYVLTGSIQVALDIVRDAPRGDRFILLCTILDKYPKYVEADAIEAECHRLIDAESDLIIREKMKLFLFSSLYQASKKKALVIFSGISLVAEIMPAVLASLPGSERRLIKSCIKIIKNWLSQMSNATDISDRVAMEHSLVKGLHLLEDRRALILLLGEEDRYLQSTRLLAQIRVADLMWLAYLRERSLELLDDAKRIFLADVAVLPRIAVDILDGLCRSKQWQEAKSFAYIIARKLDDAPVVVDVLGGLRNWLLLEGSECEQMSGQVYRRLLRLFNQYFNVEDDYAALLVAHELDNDRLRSLVRDVAAESENAHLSSLVYLSRVFKPWWRAE